MIDRIKQELGRIQEDVRSERKASDNLRKSVEDMLASREQLLRAIFDMVQTLLPADALQPGFDAED